MLVPDIEVGRLSHINCWNKFSRSYSILPLYVCMVPVKANVLDLSPRMQQRQQVKKKWPERVRPVPE